MQIIKDIEQGSPEWHKLRMGVATASNFSKIVTSTGDISKSIDGYALKLATEYFLTEPEETYKSAAMERGTELEPDARQAYEEANLSLVEQVTFIRSDCGNFGYSPDGLVDEDGLIEIKCPQDTTHLEYIISGKLPTEYKGQVQGGLMVSGRKWCDFVSYHPNFYDDKRLFIVRVERDEDFIVKLRAGIDLVISKRDALLKKLGYSKNAMKSELTPKGE